jgi:hypothetical protein
MKLYGYYDIHEPYRIVFKEVQNVARTPVCTVEVEEPEKKVKEATPIWQQTLNGWVTLVVSGTHKQIYDMAIKTKSKLKIPELEVVQNEDGIFNRFFNPPWLENCIVFPPNTEEVIGILTRKLDEPAPKKTVVKEAHADIRSHEAPCGGKWVDGIVTIPSAAKNIKCTYEIEVEEDEKPAFLRKIMD